MAEQQTTEPTVDEARDFMEKLAEFRNGLSEEEQGLMDALVTRATEPAPEAEPAGDAEAGPSKEQLDEFFAKLQAYRDGLPEPQQPLMDDVVVAAGAVAPPEPDVEAHELLATNTSYLQAQLPGRIHWLQTGPISQASSYAASCDAGTGSNKWALHANKIPFTASAVYECRTWDRWG